MRFYHISLSFYLLFFVQKIIFCISVWIPLPPLLRTNFTHYFNNP